MRVAGWVYGAFAALIIAVAVLAYAVLFTLPNIDETTRDTNDRTACYAKLLARADVALADLIAAATEDRDLAVIDAAKRLTAVGRQIETFDRDPDAECPR